MDGELGHLLANYLQELPMLFIVSQVTVGDAGEESSPLHVTVERADGVKCERCWKYATDVGSGSKWPTICGSCVAAVEEIQRGQQ